MRPDVAAVESKLVASWMQDPIVTPGVCESQMQYAAVSKLLLVMTAGLVIQQNHKQVTQIAAVSDGSI